MRLFFLILFVVTVFVPAAAHANKMFQFFPDYNVFLFFAQNTQNDHFGEQFRETIENRLEMYENDILRVHVVNDPPSVSVHGNPAPKISPVMVFENPHEVTRFYNPQNKPFLAVLIGKDGNIKKTWDVPVIMQDVFELVHEKQ